MQDTDPSDDIIAMVVSARGPKATPKPVTAASRLKTDLTMRRREMRPFFVAYRGRFAIGPADEKQFLLRYFDTHWVDDDKIKDLWLRGRCMVSSDFALRWERFQQADVTVDHFIQCAKDGVWRAPDVPQLPDDVVKRMRMPISRFMDGLVFVITLVLLPVVFLIVGGTVTSLPVVGLIGMALLAWLTFLSYRNYHREVRARRD